MSRTQIRNRLHVPLTVLVALGGLAGTGAALASAHAGAETHAATEAHAASICVPRTIKVNGHHALRECGHATATLTLGGRTYHFRGGACQRAGRDYLVALGTLVTGDPRHNEGRTSFDLTLTKKTRGLVEAYVGGHALTLTAPLIRASTDSASHGRFTSQPEPDSSVTYHGAWACHAPVVKLR
jgi:hypothetical protein